MSKRLHDAGNPRPTINDVARVAGVSTATVSRVINGSADVSEALRDIVSKTMEDLGYVRDSTARALATRRSFLIGMILPEPPSPMTSHMLPAFARANETLGFGTLVAHCKWTSPGIKAAVRRLLEHGVEGIFAAGPLTDTDIVPLFPEPGFPIAAMGDHGRSDAAGSKSQDRDTEWPGRTDIEIAVFTAARRLASHIAELGHDRIAILTTPDDEAPLADAFVEGLLSDFAIRNCTAPILLNTDNTYEAGARAGAALMGLSKLPTAVLCSNIDIAAGAMSEVQYCGLSVPGDMAFAAFGDGKSARALHPALSGIELDYSEIGQLSSECLMARINGHPVADILRLPAALTLRDSLTAPKPT